MLLSTFVSNIKRRCQVSSPANNADQVTIDIINFLNNRMYEVWRMWPWDWLWVPISFNTVIGQNIYSVIGANDTLGQPSSVGGIVALTTGDGGYLVPVTYKRYLQWLLETQINPQTQQPVQPPIGTITNYVKVGRDANGNIQILTWQTPATVVNITGYGKQRITPVTVSNITTTGFVIPYFPPEVQDVLELGVESDIYDTIGQEKNQALALAMYQAALKSLQSDEDDDEDDDGTTVPPDLYIYNKRARGGTSVV